MSRTPDEFPGERIEESIQFLSGTYQPNNVAEVAYVSGSGFILNDEGTKVRIRRRLQLFIDDGPAHGFSSGCYREMLPSGSPFPILEIWWESPAKVTKIVQLEVTRSIRQQPLIETWKMFDDDGITIMETLTDTIFYQGPFETFRSRSLA